MVLDALPGGGDNSWVDLLFSSRPFCKRKNSLISDLNDILAAEWNVDLAQHAWSSAGVGLSVRQYQDLRNMFSKAIFIPTNSTADDPRAGMFKKRPWYTCPVTDTCYRVQLPIGEAWGLLFNSLSLV